MAPRRTYRVADLFCGAGGSSSGAARAIRSMGADLDLVAVNHWDLAIATHSRNHPAAKHFCVNLDAARPEDIVPGGQLDLLMASPECTYHSRARGGKPIHDQRRMSAWHVQRWCSTLDVRCILVENVSEFRDWGPLDENGRPDPAGKGLYFQAWIQALWAMGYQAEWRILNAADFGDATTRQRFFLQARKDGRPIRWPEPSHSPTGNDDMFGGRPRWRAAREVIDWDNPGASLLTRKRPLSIKTRRRIARGLWRFGGPLAKAYIELLDLPAEDVATFDGVGPAEAAAKPFVSPFRNHTKDRGADDPLPTITASNGGGGISVVTPTAAPFLLGQRSDSGPREIERPAPTITTVSRIAVVEPRAAPFVLGQHSQSIPRPVGDPIPTVCAAGAIALVEPTVIPYYGTGVAAPVDQPLGTVTTRARFGLCLPLVVPYGPRAEARDVEQPLPTIMTRDRLGVATPVAEPFLVPHFGERDGQAPRIHDVDAPLPAVTSHGAGALAEPVVIKVNHGEGGGWGSSVDEPIRTITAQRRGFGLAEPVLARVTPEDLGEIDPRRLVYIDGELHLLDIRFRMLQNPELASAMSFDDGYKFSGNIGEVTRQIGNAVPVRTAAALVRAMLDDEVLQ